MTDRDEPPAASLDAERPGGGQPALATVIGSLFLLTTLLVLKPVDPADLPLDPAERAGYQLGSVFGGILAGVLVVWGIAYLVTIRKASRGWKIGSLLAIAAVSAFVAIMRG